MKCPRCQKMMDSLNMKGRVWWTCSYCDDVRTFWEENNCEIVTDL